MDLWHDGILLAPGLLVCLDVSMEGTVYQEVVDE